MSELFDNLSRILAASSSRRQTVRLISGALVTWGLGLPYKSATAAPSPYPPTATKQAASSPSNCPTRYCPPNYCCASNYICCPPNLGGCCGPGTVCCGRATCCTSPEVKRYRENQRQKYEQISKDLGKTTAYMGFVIGVLTIVAASNPLLRIIVASGAGAAAAIGIGSAVFGDISIDPPDQNYQVIAKPVIRSIEQQPFTTADGLTRELADALNALLENLEQSNALGSAIFKSINRADGARIAADAFWENRQLQAAQKYTLQLGKLTNDQPQLFVNFASAYNAAELPKIQVTKHDILAFQDQLSTNGLPPNLIQPLRELGANRARRGEILQNLLNVDPDQVAALGDDFPALFVNPSFGTTFREAAQALNQGVVLGK